ncbi:uncharacterized protein LOC100367812 [Saccoglossus kowalevskii]
MSDNLESLYGRLKFSEAVLSDTNISQVTSSSQDNSDVLFALKLKWKTLEEWANELRGTTHEIELQYVALLDLSIEGHPVCLKKESPRLGSLLRTRSQKVKKALSVIKNTKKKEEAREKEWKIHIYRSDIVSYNNIKTELKNLNEMQSQNVRDLNTAKKQIIEEKLVNKHLEQYINTIQGKGLCNGRQLCDLKEKQKKRKLKTLKSKLEVSLWFMKSFGLTVQNLTATSDTNSDVIFNFVADNIVEEKIQPESIRNNTVPDVAASEKLTSLSEDKLIELFELQHLLDKFCISNEAYHEMTMTTCGKQLPRSYLIKQCRKDLNDVTHIEPVPEGYGAQRNFKDLLRKEIRKFWSEENNDQRTIKVKISGDGAQMSRSANYNFLSFSILNRGNLVKSAQGNHTIACVKGKECYETIRDSFRDAITSVNEMVSNPTITIDGKSVDLDFYLGGDYKFILMVLGLKGATSNYACAWCYCSKDERHDMSKHNDFWNEPPHCRDLDSLIRLKGDFSIYQDPLFNIPLKNVAVDELHLLLRIMDILIRAVVLECHELDLNEKKNSLKALLDAVNNKVHVTFSIWQKKGSAELDWTSLTGDSKKKLLKTLPEYFEGFLRPETSATVKTIWQEFSKLYELMKSKPDYAMFQEKAKEWIRLFQSLSTKCTGYQKERITPYMHILAYHVPMMMKIHGDITLFTGQGVEKNNDEGRKVYFRRSNKADAPADILLSESRQDALCSMRRKSREYCKRTQNYWSEGIYSLRNTRPCISSTNVSTCEVSLPDFTDRVLTPSTPSDNEASSPVMEGAATESATPLSRADVLKMTVLALKEQCRTNHLGVSGNKRTLQERLIKGLKLE